jgi:endoglucanase
VVINMHHYDEIFAQPTEHQERFLAIWRQIATRYKDMPDNLYLEPLNEPHDKLTPGRWNELLAEVVDVIRQVDGVHTLIIGGAEWGGVKGLGQLRLPEDENVILTFHFYDPFLFTHQGAEWVGREYHTVGVQWPGPPAVPLTPIPEAKAVRWVERWFKDYDAVTGDRNPAGAEPIRKQLDRAVRWGEKLRKPLWMGEFGAYGKADMPSRVNWTTFMRQEAEARGITWAYWEFGAGFGVYDRETQRWNEELLHALVPE